MKQLRSLAFVLLLTATPIVAFAQSNTNTSFQNLANTVVKLLNAGAIFLITATIVVYFYGIVGNVYDLSKGETKGKMSSNIMWGIIIIFFMVSIWGIVQLLQYSLFGGPSPSATNGVVIYNGN